MDTKLDTYRFEVVRNLLKYGAVLQRVGDRTLRPIGLTQQEFAVLSAIVRHGAPVPQNNIVADLLVERSNLSKIVKRLQQKRLITVVSTSDDRRIKLLKPSPAGVAVFKRAETALRNWNKNWLQSLGDADMTRLSTLLSKLDSNGDGFD
jgi:DNA-binding MarR family transcriptional regulator